MGAAGKLLNTVVDDVDGFSVKINEMEGVLHGKMRDEGDPCGMVALPL